MVPFSVLISVYYKEKPEFLNQAILSLWDKQTLKPDQIVLVKDGPLTTELDAVIELWKKKLESVLILVSLQKNMGLAAALNEGLKKCTYNLVARMDADDVALPHRFEKQVDFMSRNADVSVSSGIIEEWSDDLSRKLCSRNLPLQSDDAFIFSKRRNPISHPAAIFNKKHVLKSGGYPEIYPEDYALWIKMLHLGFKFGNVDDVLLKMRTGDDFYSRRGFKFLKGELKIIWLQKQYGMLSGVEMFFNVIFRVLLRLSPSFLKKLAYKFTR